MNTKNAGTSATKITCDIKPFDFKHLVMSNEEWRAFVEIDPVKFYPAGPSWKCEVDVQNDIKLIGLGGHNAKSLNDPDYMPNVSCLVWKGKVIRFQYWDRVSFADNNEARTISVLECLCPKSLSQCEKQIAEAFYLANLCWVLGSRPLGFSVSKTELVVPPFKIRFF